MKARDYFMVVPVADVDGSFAAQTLSKLCSAFPDWQVTWDDRGGIGFLAPQTEKEVK